MVLHKEYHFKSCLFCYLPKPSDIVGNLVSHYVQDGNLNDKTVSIDFFGFIVVTELFISEMFLTKEVHGNNGDAH